MAWYSYELDREAQGLVIKYKDEDVLNESHKMRITASYGLERFWGEHLRLISKIKEKQKGEYWCETWQTLVDVMKLAGIEVPNKKIRIDQNRNFNTEDIKLMTQKFWNSTTFPIEHQRITLAVLTQLCDSLVWWTQRYKNSSSGNS
jgi:hypothetical protein